jgi:hypothetical protein
MIDITHDGLMELFSNITKHLELTEKILIEVYDESGGNHSAYYPRAETTLAVLTAIRVLAWTSSAIHGALEETNLEQEPD